LRMGLEEVYKRSTGSNPIGQPYENFIINIFNKLGEDRTQTLFNFLIRVSEPNDALIFEEAKKDRTNIDINKEDPFPILCRAILLLRLSTGAVSQLISESTLNVNDLRFWWEELSIQHGFITSVPSGIDAIDLYADIRDSIQQINNLPAGSISNIKDAYLNIAEPLYYLKQFQRTGIWGMGL
ncbi:MAG TPA: hypothetical protein VN958_18175, partial [Chitinophagaceae bacterium]|nr:hypothetical protein [Chitinophagaceae bacterium]